MKSVAFLLSLSFVFLTLAPEARAGCCKKQWRKFTNNISSILTLGESRRQRHEERAQNQEERARLLREAAERAKQEKITALNEKIGIYQSVVRDFEYFYDYTRNTRIEMNLLTASVQNQLNDYSWWSRYGLPAWKRSWRSESDFSGAVLEELEQLVEAQDILVPEAQEAESLEQESARLERSREALQRSRAAIYNLKEIAANAGIEMNELIAESLKRLDPQEAESALGRMIGLNNALKELDIYVDARKQYFEQQLKSAQEQLAAIIALPANPDSEEPVQQPKAQPKVRTAPHHDLYQMPRNGPFQEIY